MKLLGIVIAVLVALGVWHEVSVFSTRDNPPVSCQLLGGQWNYLTGWHCGAAAPAPAPSPTDDDTWAQQNCGTPRYEDTCACGACGGAEGGTP